MADMLITVGVDPELSYSAVQPGLAALLNKINADPPKIKVKLDFGDESTKTQQADIKKLVETTKKQTGADTKQHAAILKLNNVAGRYSTTLKQLDNALVKFSAAEHSRNSESRKAFQGIQNSANVMRRYTKAVQTNSIAQDEIEKKISEANRVLKENTAIINKNGDAHKAIFDRMGGLAAKFSAWLTMSQVIMQAVHAVKKMVTASIDINSAMTQLKIVTGATDSEMTRFLSNATVLAKELGKSITDVAGSIETFSRLGYNLTDASELAKYANILSNVANTDSETATTGLTSIIKGYSMDVSEAEHVSDVLVKVGQEYAISAEELMEAFQRGGAALYASGTDFEKSAALFAATNASLQNAESVGTLWKTVSARIRGATTELSEMGEDTEGLADGLSKYREEIKALSGVDIMKDENTYKDMYNIFVELAKVWDSMKSDEARSRVAEILGGTRQLSGIMSTITNIKDAMGAYEGAMDSAGTAASAQAEIMDSVEGRIGVFKATFQELSADVVNSDWIKKVVDFGTTVLNIIDKLINDLGALQTLILSIGGSVGAYKTIKNVA